MMQMLTKSSVFFFVFFKKYTIIYNWISSSKGFKVSGFYVLALNDASKYQVKFDGFVL